MMLMASDFHQDRKRTKTFALYLCRTVAGWVIFKGQLIFLSSEADLNRISRTFGPIRYTSQLPIVYSFTAGAKY